MSPLTSHTRSRSVSAFCLQQRVTLSRYLVPAMLAMLVLGSTAGDYAKGGGGRKRSSGSDRLGEGSAGSLAPPSIQEKTKKVWVKTAEISYAAPPGGAAPLPPVQPVTLPPPYSWRRRWSTCLHHSPHPTMPCHRWSPKGSGDTFCYSRWFFGFFWSFDIPPSLFQLATTEGTKANTWSFYI